MATDPIYSGLKSQITAEVLAGITSDITPLVDDATTQATRAGNTVPFDSYNTTGRRLDQATGMSAGDRATVQASDTGTHLAVAGEYDLGGVAATVGAPIPNTGKYAYSGAATAAGANAFNLKGAANLACANGDVLKFVHNGTGWKQV